MGGRSRVMSFMSSFGSNRDNTSSPTPTTPIQTRQETHQSTPSHQNEPKGVQTPIQSSSNPFGMDGQTSQPRVQRDRALSRPVSMINAYQPPLMDISQDTLPELQPIFTFLNSHANKLYQEGYFLKLDDQNTHGRHNSDRTWTECFAQLVGTVLSLWDAADLDVAGQDGEVLPKFINLTDASIKMIENLPTQSDDEAPLQNVLSISTAGKNRYLLHFNSHHSLIQWTAGIRLSMFEHAGLQEAYTGALIAGKGKALNNINVIMERARLPSADWARVRFGAGTPWRRCWCVITPPDEKEVQKLQKQVNKKKSAYDRSRPPTLKGDIKFYDSRRTKKVRPIATITDAYSAFAIYPQSKPLIDASTLVKVEGNIIIGSNPPSVMEGFVFVMPEVHPAVSGFEMMLRWLFPVYDTFGLYGRPGRLIPDTSDIHSLMFAMPKHRRYGYLEILDVTGLILEPGSNTWLETEWRRRMKELTQKRMTAIENGSRTNSTYSKRRSTRNSFGPSRTRLQFDDGASVRSSPSMNWGHGPSDSLGGLPRTDSAPPGTGAFTPHKNINAHTHHRSVSETQGLEPFPSISDNYDGAYDLPPPPPPLHTVGLAMRGPESSPARHLAHIDTTPERVSSEDEAARGTPVRELQDLRALSTPAPVAAPPAFAHAPGSLPISKPYHSPELRRANSRMSNGTLSQIAGSSGVAGYHADSSPRKSEDQRRPNTGKSAVSAPRQSEERRRPNTGHYSEENGQNGVLSDANAKEYLANQDRLNKDIVAVPTNRFSFEQSSPNNASNTTISQPPTSIPFRFPNNDSHNQERDVQPYAANTYITSNTPNHSSNPSAESATSTSSQLSRLQSSQSILRKPLPARSSSSQSPQLAERPSNTISTTRPVIDQATFEAMRYRKDSDSSIYEDTASTASPEYASTRRSVETRESVDRPRAGVMRTVGHVDIEDPHAMAASSSFQIDFGPTYNYASDKVPVGRQSPANMQSYGMGPGNISPALPIPSKLPGSAGHAKPTNHDTQNKTNVPEARTLAWRPGMAAVGNMAATQPGISAEQFVQQRAAVPQYSHRRQQSSATLTASQAYGRNTPTPPLDRNRSSEYLAQRHSRNSSTDLLQRPSSRAANVALGPLGNGDITSALSAREQEHIARLTGQPLVNMAQTKQPPPPAVGLVGAIDAREKDKAQMKKGLNSQAVELAIAQRQQEAYYQQQSHQMNMDHYAQAQQNNMGQYQFPARGQSQQQWTSPAANVFSQGGGWLMPSPGFAAPEQGRQSPSQYPARNQSYFQAPQVPSPVYAIPDHGRQSPSQYPPRNQSYFQAPQQGGQYFQPPQGGQQGGQGRGR